MINVTVAEEIISVGKVGDIFSPDTDKIKNEYRLLAKMWHPDYSHDSQATEVFAKINSLYEKAVTMAAAGAWERTGFMRIPTGKGPLDISYLTVHSFELGQIYIGDSRIYYVVEHQHEKFVRNAVTMLSRLTYADSRMEDEFRKRVPHGIKLHEAVTYLIVEVEKPPDMISLADVISYFDHGMEGRHAAWIISRLYNMCCFLSYNGMVHGGIKAGNCYICPATHDLLLAGGWWYTVMAGQKMLGTSKDIYEVMPVMVKDSKIAAYDVDLESVKLIGRNMTAESILPPRLAEWLQSGSGKDPFEEFKKWYQALDKSYGERRFVELKLNSGDLYNN